MANSCDAFQSMQLSNLPSCRSCPDVYALILPLDFAVLRTFPTSFHFAYLFHVYRMVWCSLFCFALAPFLFCSSATCCVCSRWCRFSQFIGSGHFLFLSVSVLVHPRDVAGPSCTAVLFSRGFGRPSCLAVLDLVRTYIHLSGFEIWSSFILVLPFSHWRQHPVFYEWS